MKLSKENAMLLDIQYIKPKKNEHPDYLYIIWKDLDTSQKHLQVIPEPRMDIYFEKPELRNHLYNKSYQRLDCVDKKTVKYKDIIFAIAEDLGDYGKQKLEQIFRTGNYRQLQEFYISPYVFGADIDVRAWYRQKWLEQFNNNRPKPLSKGFMDIEVDIMSTDGTIDAIFDPIDLVTLIDTTTNQSYTFALIGVDYPEKDMTGFSPEQIAVENKKKKMYESRIRQQEWAVDNVDELKRRAHDMFDESYPEMEYNFYFYKDERKMITHLFQLINKLKLDFIGIWNIAFDIPYIMDRLTALDLDPAEIMCHNDFPVKECWFKKDNFNFQIKNKSDWFHVSSYTIFFDQMRNYAAIRKGQQELRSTKLTYIAQKEIGDEKLDYSEDATIKTLSYVNYIKYILYNIKDVLLQTGIEKATTDLETFYITSYNNITPYEHEFKQTVKLTNVRYRSYLEQGLIPGENVNGFMSGYKEEREEDDEEDDEENASSTKKGFEGALVGDPTLITNFGEKLYGKKTNNIFNFSIDMDMGKFYPSNIDAMNIEPSTLFFKMILKASEYDVRGGKLPFNGITDVIMNENLKTNSFNGDVAKEVMDNFQTKNYISTACKWLNFPSIGDVVKELEKRTK